MVKTFGKPSPETVDLSPNGRYIAYDRPQDEGTSKRDIFVLDLSGNREITLVKHPANDRLIGWTPDGKRVLFASDRRGTWDAWLLQVTGGGPQGYPELVKQDIGDVTPIGFTQSGSYYYRNEQMLGDVFVATLDLETGKVLSPTMPVRQTGATNCPEWSPDGQYLAYCTRRPDKSQIIHIRTLATGQERELDTELPHFGSLRWSADGRSIVPSRGFGQESPQVIYKIDVQTGDQTALVRSETERLGRAELSPDGKTLFYDCHDPDSKTKRLMARDLETGQEKELLQTRSSDTPRWDLSPDGQHLALGLGLTDCYALKIIPVAGGEPRELLRFEKEEEMWLVGVAWTPDGQYVLFPKWLMGGKGGELWRISAEGSEPQKLWE